MNDVRHIVEAALASYKPHKTGPDKVRAICPSCGGANNNTLSVWFTPNGAAVMKCFKMDCGIELICAALGLKVSDLFPARVGYPPPAGAAQDA